MLSHGIVVDPIWTLSAWEVASNLSETFTTIANKGSHDNVIKKSVMVHTGGSELALEGLKQRLGPRFAALRDQGLKGDDRGNKSVQ